MIGDLNFQESSPVSSKFGWANIIKKNVIVAVAIVVAALVIAGAIFYVGYYKGKKGTLTAQQAADKAMSYINQNLVASGTTASLVNVSEQDGIYKFQLKIQDQQYDSYVTKDGKLLFVQQPIDMDATTSSATGQNNTGGGGAQQTGTTTGDFSISSDQICQENNKPIIYFFGSESCPHCRWEKPIIEAVANNFKDYISFHENIDNQNDSDVFNKYSASGYIPTLVLGCKYYRVGSGESAGESTETNNLTALFCKLTDGKPTSVCASVQDLINQIQ